MTKPVHAAHSLPSAIGPLGVASRLVVGVLLIGLAVFWRDPSWTDLALALALAAIFVCAGALLAQAGSAPVRATGPVGHLLNAAVFVPLFIIPATAGAAFLFYGASMLVAATRRSGGCEVTAISNAVLDRDDQVGCMIFAPVDIVEARLRRRPSASEAG
jgi:hypothetical protein